MTNRELLLIAIKLQNKCSLRKIIKTAQALKKANSHYNKLSGIKEDDSNSILGTKLEADGGKNVKKVQNPIEYDFLTPTERKNNRILSKAGGWRRGGGRKRHFVP